MGYEVALVGFSKCDWDGRTSERKGRKGVEFCRREMCGGAGCLLGGGVGKAKHRAHAPVFRLYGIFHYADRHQLFLCFALARI